jgi:multicomponent Na+:H+ antiporter subunit D
MILYSFFAIPSYMATAFVIILVSLKRDSYVPIVAITGALIAAGLSLLAIPQILPGAPVSMQMEEWVAPYGITIFGDYLSVTLACLISLIALMAMIFSSSYIRERRAKYYSLLSLLFAGMFGVVHTGDMFNLFVFMELLSVSSYGIIAFPRNRPALEASIKYLIMGSLGTSLLLVGVAFLYGLTGSLNMADIAVRLSGLDSPAVGVAFGLILSGLAIKAGLVPFHALHLDGYTAAPTPVSAVLAALVANVGLYAILRVSFILFSMPAAALQVLLWFGAVSMTLGAVLALRQSDLKRMLAYSGVSQVGLIAMSVGLGTSLGLVGGLFHMLNQALIKGLLFFCAGAVVYFAKTADLERLSGMLRTDRILSFSFLTGVLALAGVPLFNGFASKWVIYIAALEVNPALMLLAVLVSAITLAYGLKAYSVIFSGNPSGKSVAVRLPLSMKVPLVLLSALIIIIGVLPWIGIELATLMAGGLDSAAYIQGVHI